MTHLPEPFHSMTIGLLFILFVIVGLAILYRVCYQFFYYVGAVLPWHARSAKQADAYLLKKINVPTSLNDCQEFMVRNSNIFQAYPKLYDKYNDLRKNVVEQHNQLTKISM